ncbi:Homeobox-leucine zipper protein GLABRA 2 [Acorus calamus]|uniref:Homeobox-leucine zipper protein GLABRA 2 n=1 Tax=Acorus calamus TaxID=4465 RepID=A0AAV9CM22_ACOCL|nr:Homeobox-leucine zipper protein GLABRA 2 [Acorus calamus]
MEALFKESPHPDEKQRQQLSKRLGLAPRQVKFWFQNRRTQIKAIQERHENSLLKSEIEKLREENRNLRESKKKACCLSCGFSGRGGPAMVAEEQQLKNENARLKIEVEKLRGMVGRFSGRASPPNFSSSTDNEQHIMNLIQHEDRFFGLEKSKISDIVDGATSELLKMATTGEPLWVRSIEARRDILDYNAYIKEFSQEDSTIGRARKSIEASRESGVVFLDAPRLVQVFMDVNQWKDMFACMVYKAATVDVICEGEGPNRSGAVQLMSVELQMLTPMVPTRELHFVRSCKQLSLDKWVIVDVSVDDSEGANHRRRPSGCVIEDQSNGHCKVTWVEHSEYLKALPPPCTGRS